MENKKIYSKSGYVSDVIKRKDNYIAEIDGVSYWSKHDIFNLKDCNVEITYMTSATGDKIYNWIQNVINFENAKTECVEPRKTEGRVQVGSGGGCAPTVREEKYTDNKTLNTCLMVAGEITKVAYVNPDNTPKVNPVDYCVGAFNALMKAVKG